MFGLAAGATLFSAMFLLATSSRVAMATPITFDFSYTGTGVTASGQLFTDGVLSGGAYTVTNITGTRNGVGIAGLVSFVGDDDLLYVTAPVVDNEGISYAASGIDYNLFLVGGGSFCVGVNEISSTAPNSFCDSLIPVSVIVTEASDSTSTVPEPSSLAILGAGIAALGWMRRKRKAS